MTSAPSILQIWIAAEPTPEPAPSTSTVCAGPQSSLPDEHVPRCKKDERDASGGDEVERVRNGDDVRRAARR